MEEVILVRNNSQETRTMLLADLQKFMNGSVIDNELQRKSKRQFKNRIYKTKG